MELCTADPNCTAIDYGKNDQVEECYINTGGDGKSFKAHENFDSYVKVNANFDSYVEGGAYNKLCTSCDYTSPETKVLDKSLNECMELCTADPNCKAIDYRVEECYINTGGDGESYTAHANFDSYVKVGGAYNKLCTSCDYTGPETKVLNKSLNECMELCTADPNCKAIDYRIEECYINT